MSVLFHIQYIKINIGKHPDRVEADDPYTDIETRMTHKHRHTRTDDTGMSINMGDTIYISHQNTDDPYIYT